MGSWFPVLCTAIIFIVTLLLRQLGLGRRKKQGKWIHSLENKHVLITGGSRGIGLSIAVEVLRQQGLVTLISNSCSEIDEALQNLTQQGIYSPHTVFTKVADVGDYEGISMAIKESFEWRPFDVVICNAGVAEKIGRLDEMGVGEIDLVIRTNLSGVVYTAHAALPLMKQRGNKCRQSLVLMGSMSSLHPFYGHGIYTATKHALKGVAECLLLELLPFNIRVTLCCPDFTKTALLKEAGHYEAAGESFVRIMEVVDSYDPSRMVEPREIAKATVEEGIKEGSFMVVVASHKFQGWLVSAFSRGLFPAESLLTTAMEMVVFVSCRMATHLVMAIVKKTIRREHNKEAVWGTDSRQVRR